MILIFKEYVQLTPQNAVSELREETFSPQSGMIYRFADRKMATSTAAYIRPVYDEKTCRDAVKAGNANPVPALNYL